jgi:hypothetical protein
MISFTTMYYPSSMDEYINERECLIEYLFEDEGLLYYISLIDDKGEKENIEHLLDDADIRKFLALIAENEHEIAEKAKQELAEFEYESRYMI